jgi:hypothetical protein
MWISAKVAPLEEGTKMTARKPAARKPAAPVATKIVAPKPAAKIAATKIAPAAVAVKIAEPAKIVKAPKIKASVWSKIDKCNWLVTFGGVEYLAAKIGKSWVLLDSDLAQVDDLRAEVTLRKFWQLCVAGRLSINK